jgi:alpha-amylase
MVDVVVNHMGWAGNGTSVDYTKLIPFTDSSSYHPYCGIPDVNNQTQVEDVGVQPTEVCT